MRKQIAAANWKMNLSLQEGQQLIDDLLAGPHSLSGHQYVVFGVPFPYLAMAACLASGLYGIKHQLPLNIPATKGSGYNDKDNGVLPSNLLDATTHMQHSSVAKDLLGEDFVDHFTNTRLWECRQFAKHVSDWELKRYFEII